MRHRHFPSAARARVALWLVRLMMSIGLLAAGPSFIARAHANLVASDPPAGAVLHAAPNTLTLEFSEALDERITAVKILNADAQVVIHGPGVVDPSNPRLLRLSIGSLPHGTYSAVWKALSAVDGHVTQGSVGFSIGEASSPVSLLPPVNASEPATAWPRASDALLRALSYLASAMLVGSFLFGLLVWRPTLRGLGGGGTPADLHATRLLRWLALLGGVGLVVAVVGLTVSQALQLTEDGGGQAFTTLFVQLLSGRTGLIVLTRLAMVAGVMLLAWRLPPVVFGSAGRWWLALAVGLGILLTFSLQSHGAALESPLAIALDWLHFVVASAWLGGLLPLGLLLRTARRPEAPEGFPPLAPLVANFSRLALTSVALLAATGLYSAWLHVQTLEALVSTSYGRALSLKIGFFLILLLLGAVNFVVLSPRLRQEAGRAGLWLQRTVRAELAIGLLVLVAAGLITSLSPAFEALQAQQRLGLRQAVHVDGVDLVLRVAPLQIGENEFGVDVVDRRPGAAGVEPTVFFQFSMADHDMGETRVPAISQDGQRYTARGSYLFMAGRWKVETIVRRPGFNDVRHVFELPSLETESTGLPAIEIELEADNLLYSRPRLEVAVHQPVRLTFRNHDVVEHDFVIDTIPVKDVRETGDKHAAHEVSDELDLHTSTQPDGVSRLEFTPTAPGVYEFYCTVPGHKEAGMKGDLIVR